jgi:hypothetical protein
MPFYLGWRNKNGVEYRFYLSVFISKNIEFYTVFSVFSVFSWNIF